MLTRRMITRGVRRQNKARREFLQEPRDGLIVFGNACNSVANARKFFVRLATVLQTSKGFSGHLQHSCKRQKVFRAICSVPANPKKFLEAFAALLQSISKSSALPLALYQRHSSGIRILILSPNSRLECVSYRFFA